MYLNYLYYLSSTYGEGAYNTSVYNNDQPITGSQTSSGGGGGVLTNAGFDVLLVATIACVVIFAALVVRLWRKSSKTKKKAD